MKKLVVLTGAGMSAESGLKTFRDSDGLWEGYNVEDVATPDAWRRNPKMVLDFYNERRAHVAAARPNSGHFGFAELEKYFDVTIITQNIDDLHERAGSAKVVHLHGEIFKMRSEKNEEQHYEIRSDISMGDIAGDGGQLRPYIVWFGEPVYMMETAIPLVRDADIFVVAGTSLAVYPAAGLVNYAGHEVPKYIIDKKVPFTNYIKNLITIEKPATEGVRDLIDLLTR